VSSTEFIQKEEAAEKYGERDPEVEVGGDGAKHVAGSVGRARRHCSLGIELAESGEPS
jgi:hypothetical protein